MSSDYEKEKSLLKLSTISCLLFAAFGIVLGLSVDSMVIVFDGAYSLVSLVLTLIALAATMYIRPADNHPSKCISQQKIATIEALVVLIKGLVITILCLVSFCSALAAMFNGGREVNAVAALIFGVINVVGCLSTYLALTHRSGKKASIILRAESNQWLMDTIISGAVLIGFIGASALMMTDFAEYAVYADPLMVLIASIYFVSVPIKMSTDSMRKLFNLSTNKNKRLKADTISA